jgi:Putative peptidoglycan binding domain
MPFMYRAAQGECLSSIAGKYRFADWRTIYNHPQNTGLRQKRPNPNIIYPGDEIWIPDLDPGEKSAPTDLKHRYVLKKEEQVRIRIRVQDQRGLPFAGKQYTLEIEDSTYEGTTGPDGLIEAEIPHTASTGALTVRLEDDEYDDCTWHLDLGSLDPIEEVSGVQGRLNNLGYICGPVDGIAGPRTKDAVMAFQAQAGLSASGTIDKLLREKLLNVYDKM